MIGDFLYRLTPRDEQTTPIELVRKQATWVTPGTQFTARFLPARGKLFVVTTIACYAAVGAGTVGSIFGTIATKGVNEPRALVFGQVSGAASLILERAYPPGTVMIDGRDEQLNIEVNYTSGVAAHDTRIWVSGYLLPIGIVALGDVDRIQVP